VYGNARNSIPVAVFFAETDNHEPTVGVDEETHQRYLEAQLNTLHGNTPPNPRTLPKPRIWIQGARSLRGGASRSVLFSTTPIAIDPQNISEVNYRKALASNIQHVPEPIERKHLSALLCENENIPRTGNIPQSTKREASVLFCGYISTI
jgi:hypothetical protein